MMVELTTTVEGAAETGNPAPDESESKTKTGKKHAFDFRKAGINVLTGIVLLFILAMAFHMRIQPYLRGVQYINLDDPHYVYKMTDFVMKNKYLPAVDYQSYYPVGRPLYLREDQALLYWLVAIIGWIGQAFIKGFNAYAATMFQTPITGALQVIPLFFLVFFLTRKRLASLFAATIYAVLPGALSRTLSGFSYKEGFGLLFMLIGFCFLVKAYEKKSLILSIVSGLFLAIMGYTWNGVQIPTLFLTLLATILILLERSDGTELLLIPVFMAIFGGIMFPPYIYNHTLFEALLVPAFLLVLKRVFKVKVGAAVIFAIMLFALSILAPTFFSNSLYYLAHFDIGASSAGLASTVAQNALTDSGQFYSQLGISTTPPMKYLGALVLAVLACIAIIATVAYRFTRRMKKEKISINRHVWKHLAESITFHELFVLCFVLFGFWFGKGAVRLMIATAIPVSVGAGFLFVWAWVAVARFFKGNNAKYAKGAVLVVAVLILYLHVNAGYADARNTGTSMHPDWINGLNWLRDNTPADSKVWSWWDYGYVIQAIANRTSIVDPRNFFEFRDIEAALVFTAKEENQTLQYNDGIFNISYASTMDYMKHYNISYVILDYPMVGKYSAVSKIANHGKYIDVIADAGQTDPQLDPGRFGPFTVEGTNPPRVYYNTGTAGQRIPINNICTKTAIINVSSDGFPGCAYVYSNHLFYVNWRQEQQPDGTYTTVPSDSSAKSIFVKLWFDDAESLQHFKLVHTSPYGYVKIYQVINNP